MASQNTRVDNDEIEIDLKAFFLKLKTQWGFCFIWVVICALISMGYSTFLSTPHYQSTAMVYLRGNKSTSFSLQDLQAGVQLTKDYEIIFKSRPVLEKTIKDLDLNMTTKELANMVTISNETDTRILKISAEADTPTLAKKIANSIMNTGVDEVSEIDSQQPYIVERAVSNPVKVGMSRTKKTILGALAGLILSVAFVFIRFVFNDNVTSADDIEDLLNVPVLAVVLDDPKLDNKRKK